LVNYVQIFREEDHAVMGALRMHGVDIQTNPPGVTLPDHRNPEEILYVLRGKGKAFSGGETHELMRRCRVRGSISDVGRAGTLRWLESIPEDGVDQTH
jgi:hypothetical protein